MPQKVKYVGPMDTKVFRDFHFVRDVSDDASGGNNAVELPDAVANAALKHKDVFMQWDHKVPDAVKHLRLREPEAAIKEHTAQRKHWLKRVAAAENLPEDNPRQELIKAQEIAGAEAQADYHDRKLQEAQKRLRDVREEHLLSGGEANIWLTWAEAPTKAAPKSASQALDEFRKALKNVPGTDPSLHKAMTELLEHMIRDSRASRDEQPTIPAVGAIGPGGEGDIIADPQKGWTEMADQEVDVPVDDPAAQAAIERPATRRRTPAG